MLKSKKCLSRKIKQFLFLLRLFKRPSYNKTDEAHERRYNKNIDEGQRDKQDKFKVRNTRIKLSIPHYSI